LIRCRRPEFLSISMASTPEKINAKSV